MTYIYNTALANDCSTKIKAQMNILLDSNKNSIDILKCTIFQLSCVAIFQEISNYYSYNYNNYYI